MTAGQGAAVAALTAFAHDDRSTAVTILAELDAGELLTAASTLGFLAAGFLNERDGHSRLGPGELRDLMLTGLGQMLAADPSP